jgi:hypothetical protein
VYTYPFQFQLPVNLPPSFASRSSDDRADMQYYVKAYVDIPHGRDAVNKQHFTVLSAMPQQQWVHRAPAQVDRYWDVTCCCCVGKGKCAARLFMDRTVIAIDRDQLFITADIDNSGCEEPVESLEITLTSTIEYSARGVRDRNVQRVGQTFLKNKVEAGAKGRIQGVVPVNRNACPTVSTRNCTVSYVVSIELNIPMASDPQHSFPVVLTHCVDETNFLPPVSVNGQAQGMWGGGYQAQEFFYQPPPTPCYAYNPLPLPPPPQAMMWQAPPPAFQMLPPVGFGGPTAYGHVAQAQPPPPQQMGQVHWQAGCQSTQMSVHVVDTTQPPMGVYGATAPVGQQNQGQQNQQAPLLQNVC